MKTHRLPGFLTRATILALLLLACGATSRAQTNISIPIVTVVATDPSATEGGNTAGAVADPGMFTFYRAGSTNSSLSVYYLVGGTASNGVDYAHIGNFVSIPAGVTSAQVPVVPFPDNLVEGDETVVVQLAPSPLLTPVNYEIGVPSNAVVTIHDRTTNSGTNLPPTVKVVSPTNGAVFYTPVDIPLLARANDLDDTVTNVEFFAGGTDLGRGMLVVLDPPGVNGVVGPVYFLNWTNVQPASYSVTAVATDSRGASGASAPVAIAVLPGPPPPPTNVPPTVRIVIPTNGALYAAGTSITLFADAHDSDGSVSNVEFFENGTSLGIATNNPYSLQPGNVFHVTWTNVPPGGYALTARATDNLGAMTLSLPVNISVVTNLPPPTPVVSILALDAVASEGTNFCNWIGATSAGATNFSGTNGPCTNTATFVVRRGGSTNADLTVNYAIGGTASNGVDYETLSGVVTIPAGRHTASITVVPIDDTIPEPIEMVILTLSPSASSPPDYLVGYASKAAAIIVDNDRPRPSLLSLADECFHVTMPGTNGACFRLEISSDLTHWTPFCTNVVTDGAIHFVDPDAPGINTRFYRVLPEPSVPLND